MTTHVDVAAFAIGSLDIEESDSFEGHLDTCPTCPAELEWLSQIVQLMTSVTFQEDVFADTVLSEAS